MTAKKKNQTEPDDKVFEPDPDAEAAALAKITDANVNLEHAEANLEAARDARLDAIAAAVTLGVSYNTIAHELGYRGGSSVIVNLLKRRGKLPEDRVTKRGPRHQRPKDDENDDT